MPKGDILFHHPLRAAQYISDKRHVESLCVTSWIGITRPPPTADHGHFTGFILFKRWIVGEGGHFSKSRK